MKKSNLPFNIFFLFTLLSFSANVISQVNVHLSDFDESQGEAFVTSGAIGTTPWQISRSGDDWGGRVHNSILELTNTASSEANANGWVYAHLETEDFSNPYNPILNTNSGMVSWYFNMRQIRDNPAGFSGNSYGAAFIIGSSMANIATEGDGYAIVLGNTGSPDPIRFVKFSAGIQSLATSVAGLIIAEAPLNDPRNNYMSIKLSYNPGNNEWNLYGRNDGGSFQDPQTGDLTLLGTATDDTHTGVNLAFMGAYWQGSTAANQTAYFDNVSIWVEGTGANPPVITNITQTPDSEITPETTVSVSAEVTAGDAPVDNVVFLWGLISNDLSNTINMSNNDSNTYTTDSDIPAQNHNTTVYYRIVAEDEDGEIAMSPIQNYIVIDPDIEMVIVSVESIPDITVDFGTPFNDIPLPETVTVSFDNDDPANLEVEWIEGNYDANAAGTYTFTGELTLASGMTNPDELKASVNVIVEADDDNDEVIVAGWTFPAADAFGADLGTEDNIGKEISREASFELSYSFPPGITSQSISTSSWTDGENTKFWIVEFSTLSYGNLVLSSAQQSSDTGPRDFKVQYRFGSNDWADLADSEITVANNFTDGVINNLSLPELLNNKPSVSLRWIMTSNTRVTGDGTVAGAGTSRIDNLIIEGVFSDDFKRIVTGVEELEDINVDVFEANFEDLELPETVLVFFDDEGSEELPVVWAQGDFDGDVVGEYILDGEITLEDNMENPQEIKATIIVNVNEPIILHTVTFNLDIGTHPTFNPETDKVYIRGDMNNWGVPGTDEPNQLLTQTDSPMIYTITFELEEGNYDYKYYRNPGTSNPESGDDRLVEVTEPMNVNDSWSSVYIQELNAGFIKIFPNPTNNYLNISSDYIINSIKLLDLQGRIVSSIDSVESLSFTLDLQGLPGGVYLIKVNTINGIQTHKIFFK